MLVLWMVIPSGWWLGFSSWRNVRKRRIKLIPLKTPLPSNSPHYSKSENIIISGERLDGPDILHPSYD